MPSNPAQTETCIVRFKDKKGKLVGAGILVSADHIVTCAHVVAAADDLPPGVMPPSMSSYTVLFPFCGNHEATASLIVLGPISQENIPSKDWAVLQLTSSLPVNALPQPFALFQEKWHQIPFRTWGATEQNPSGNWVLGSFAGMLPDKTVQMFALHGAEIQIEEGFSGGPVWAGKNDQIIGILVQKDNRKKISYMIPAIEIKNVWDDLPVTKIGPSFVALNRLKRYEPDRRKYIPYLGDRNSQKDEINFYISTCGKINKHKPCIGILLSPSDERPTDLLTNFVSKYFTMIPYSAMIRAFLTRQLKLIGRHQPIP